MPLADPVGAVDAFFSVAVLSAAKKLPIKLGTGTLIGQLGVARAVKFAGNQSHLSRAVLLKTRKLLLSF